MAYVYLVGSFYVLSAFFRAPVLIVSIVNTFSIYGLLVFQ